MLDGDLLELPGGPLKLAVGAALRRENFDRKVDSFTSGIAPVLGALNASERDVAAVYAEARIPLFGAGNSRPGLERLELSLAARFEDYGDVGQGQRLPEGHPGGGLKASGGGLAPQQDDVDAAVRRAVVPEGSADAFGCGPGLAPGPDAGFELGDDLVGDAGVEVGT